MNKRQLRFGLKWSIPVNLLLFTLAALDYLFWASRLMPVILGAYILFLVGLLVLLILDETPHFQRLSLEGESEGPKTIIYGRR